MGCVVVGLAVANARKQFWLRRHLRMCASVGLLWRSTKFVVDAIGRYLGLRFCGAFRQRRWWNRSSPPVLTVNPRKTSGWTFTRFLASQQSLERFSCCAHESIPGWTAIVAVFGRAQQLLLWTTDADETNGPRTGLLRAIVNRKGGP